MKKHNQKLVIPTHVNRHGFIQQPEAHEKWEKIQSAIHMIYEQNASQLSFQTLYTAGYQLVLHKFGDMLYDGVRSTMVKYIEGVRDACNQKVDEQFLSELLAQWRKHRTAVVMIRDILMYLDRNYVPQTKPPKKAIFDLGIELFGNEVFEHRDTQERIQRLVMEIIRRDRDGDGVVDRFQLREMTTMMLEISKPRVYEKVFEERFLRESREYYTKEAQLFFESCTATDYLRKVTQRLKEERDRSQRTMDPETRPKIENVLKNTMIERYKELIIEKEGSGCRVMLENWLLDDLKLVFEVLGLVKDALSPLVELVKSYCIKQGLDIVTDKELDENRPLEMVQKLIDLHERQEILLRHSFSTRKGAEVHKDKDFADAVWKAFDKIVNENERLPEYLSLYIDSKLKKGAVATTSVSSVGASAAGAAAASGDVEFDTLFDQIIALFRHLSDKDLFEKYYKTHLAKRLLADKSQSDDAEKSFIAKLKTEFGFQFTSKLEGMFNDMRISRDNNEQYRTYKELNQGGARMPPIDITVQVLTTGYWPVPAAPKITGIPKELVETSEHFTEFYLNKHSGRRLAWQYHMGTADLRTNGFDKKYELNVSTFQMILLLMFNDAEQITYDQFCEATKIPAQELKKNLLALCVKSKSHEKLLNKAGPEGEASTTAAVNKDTVFTINPDFTSKLVRCKIAPVVIKETKEQAKETKEKNDEERNYVIDACVVRIMKSRRTVEHKDLVIECTKQLQSRFLVDPQVLKKRVESLIEREYLQRAPDSRTKYIYMA